MRDCQHPYNEGCQYVFQTSAWNEAAFASIILTEVYRQKDREWIDMLSRIKLGDVDDSVLDFLESLRRPLPEISGLRPTKLYTHKSDVQLENDREFEKLEGPVYRFKATDSGRVNPIPTPKKTPLFLYR